MAVFARAILEFDFAGPFTTTVTAGGMATNLKTVAYGMRIIVLMASWPPVRTQEVSDLNGWDEPCWPRLRRVQPGGLVRMQQKDDNR